MTGLLRDARFGARMLFKSPTFTLVNEYSGRLQLIHLDLYRLENLPAGMLPDDGSKLTQSSSPRALQ